MSHPANKRQGGDRRRYPRGGRRDGDVSGFTPLVFVVDSQPSGRDACEAILAKLRFAVAPFESVEHARRALDALKPDLVLVAPEHLDAMRRALPPGRNNGPLPVLPLPSGDLAASTLIEDIRSAVRVALAQRSSA